MNKEENITKLQAVIKRKQIQPLYNKYLQTARINYTKEQLKELSKPYTIQNLRKSWNEYSKDNTIYGKASNKLTKAELYHELLNINFDFSQLQKKEPKTSKTKMIKK